MINAQTSNKRNKETIMQIWLKDRQTEWKKNPKSSFKPKALKFSLKFVDFTAEYKEVILAVKQMIDADTIPLDGPQECLGKLMWF